MKKIKLLFAVLLFSGIANAQSNKEDIDMIQAMFGKEKKDIVTQYMEIPEDQKATFWTTYDQYEAERKAYGRSRIALIEEYANSYAGLTDETATSLMNKKMTLNSDFGKLQKKYFDKFRKVIGGKQAAKFFQLEDYIENNIRLAIQEEIPFIGELDQTKK